MKTTSRLLLAAAAGVLAAVSAPAQALVKWNFVDSQCIGVCDNTSREYSAYSAGPGDPAPGSVTATGWANTSGSDDTMQQGEILQFGTSGVGVVNADAAIEIEDSPEHSVDNIDRYDLVLFRFEDKLKVEEVGIGWFSGDSDVSLLAFVGGGVGDTPDIDGVNYTGTSEGLTSRGWEVVGNYDVDTPDPDPDVGDASDVIQVVDTDVSSHYWIVAAFNNVFSSPEANDPNDALGTSAPDKVKILSLAGSIDQPVPPDGNVNAPASLALLLGGVVPVLRRRQRRRA